MSDRPSMRLLRWKPLIKNSLRGFADVELPIGLRIHKVPVLSSHGKTWAALPSKPVLSDGRHKTDVNGKLAYSPILEWRSRELSDAFSLKVVALVRAKHPEDLDEEGAR